LTLLELQHALLVAERRTSGTDLRHCVAVPPVLSRVIQPLAIDADAEVVGDPGGRRRNRDARAGAALVSPNADDGKGERIVQRSSAAERLSGDLTALEQRAAR